VSREHRGHLCGKQVVLLSTCRQQCAHARRTRQNNFSPAPSIAVITRAPTRCSVSLVAGHLLQEIAPPRRAIAYTLVAYSGMPRYCLLGGGSRTSKFYETHALSRAAILFSSLPCARVNGWKKVARINAPVHPATGHCPHAHQMPPPHASQELPHYRPAYPHHQPPLHSNPSLPPAPSMSMSYPPTRPYHTYIVSRCFYGCKCLNSRTRGQQGGWHPHPSQQMSR